MRTSRVELGARGVRGEERDGRGRGEGEPLRGRGETTRRGPRIFRRPRMRGGRRSRRGGRGEPRGRGARGARGRSGRALRRRRWMPCRAGSCRGAAISGRAGAKSERKLDWTRHPSFSSPKLLNSHTTTKLRLCANAAWSLIVTITSPDGPHARRLARTAGASPPTAAPPPGAVPSTPSPSRRRSHFVVIIAPETRDETTNRE